MWYRLIFYEAGKERLLRDDIRDRLLQEVNNFLAPLEEWQVSQFTQPQFPVVFVIGTPRCGHTLLSQLLAASGGFAYINNFVARFWMVPAIGAQIELALGICEQQQGQSYSSEYGRTTGWAGPHEFGCFLRRWLPFGETHKVELEALSQETANRFAQEVAALEAVYGKPLFLRNIIYSLNIDLLLKIFPNSVFVVCRREVLYQAQSILIARRKIAGDKQNWWSLRPKEYRDLIRSPVWEQIAGQIYYTYKDIETNLAQADRRRWLEVHYSDLCREPQAQVGKIVKVVERLGKRTDWKSDTIPDQFDSTDVQRVSDADFQKLREAVQRYFGNDLAD